MMLICTCVVLSASYAPREFLCTAAEFLCIETEILMRAYLASHFACKSSPIHQSMFIRQTSVLNCADRTASSRARDRSEVACDVVAPSNMREHAQNHHQEVGHVSVSNSTRLKRPVAHGFAERNATPSAHREIAGFGWQHIFTMPHLRCRSGQRCLDHGRERP
jgi:hypothetical protein